MTLHLNMDDKAAWSAFDIGKEVSETALMLMPTQELFLIKEDKESRVKRRVSEPLRPEDIVKKIQDAIPKKTKDNNKWALSVWVAWSLDHPETLKDGGQGIPADPYLFTDALMNYWIAHFIQEYRRQDGRPYPPNTLMQNSPGIQRY